MCELPLNFLKDVYLFSFGIFQVLIAASELPLFSGRQAHSLLWSAGFSLQWRPLLQSTDSRSGLQFS